MGGLLGHLPDDTPMPDNIFHCKSCDKIIMDECPKYCSNCGKTLYWDNLNEETFMVIVPNKKG